MFGGHCLVPGSCGGHNIDVVLPVAGVGCQTRHKSVICFIWSDEQNADHMVIEYLPRDHCGSAVFVVYMARRQASAPNKAR